MRGEKSGLALAAQAGCDSKDVAAALWREGLVVDGERLRPGTWHKASPDKLKKALKVAVRSALGLASFDRPTNPARPQTAADYFMQLGLLHPVFRERLLGLVPTWIRRARPPVNVPHLAGVQPCSNVHLQCAPRDRSRWTKLLANHCDVVSTEKTSFDLRHSMIVILTDCSYNFSAQTLPAYHRGLHAAALREERGASALPSEHNAGETRLLLERPVDPADTRELFAAAKKARIFQLLEGPTGSYTLARREPAIKRLFYTRELKPLSQTARFFQEKLKDRRFLGFVEVHYPGIPSWATTALRLADASEPKRTAEELVQLGVLKSHPDGSYQMAGPVPTSLRHAPTGLYRWQYLRWLLAVRPS